MTQLFYHTSTMTFSKQISGNCHTVCLSMYTEYDFAAYAPGTNWLFWKLLVVDKCGWEYILHWFFETTLLCCLIDCHTKAHQVIGHMACYVIHY